MSTMKLVALLLVSFVATASVVYQIRSRRPARPVTSSAPKSAAIIPPAPPSDPGQTTPAQPGSASPVAAPAERSGLVPASGWGRNPFLTKEEIEAANKVPAPEIAGVPAPIAPAQPAAAPTYAVTAIIYGPNGSFAVVNSRVVQAGDRV